MWFTYEFICDLITSSGMKKQLVGVEIMKGQMPTTKVI
jgi:hypothetical protein